MYGEYFTDSDSFNGVTVFDYSITGIDSSSGVPETSGADELADSYNEEDFTSGDTDIESDNTYSDLIDSIAFNTSSIDSINESLQLNNETIDTLQEDLSVYFASQELLLKGIIILLLGYIVISIVKKTFDIF